MQIHQIKRKTPNKKGKIIGRGGKRGTTAGRGTKGQKARSGHSIRPEIRDTIKRLPKRRGYSAPKIITKPTIVNLSYVSLKFKDGEEVSPRTLLEKGLIRRKGGKLPVVKILGGGKLEKKVTFKDVKFSKQAQKHI